jgi:hypothetical protein
MGLAEYWFGSFSSCVLAWVAMTARLVMACRVIRAQYEIIDFIA